MKRLIAVCAALLSTVAYAVPVNLYKVTADGRAEFVGEWDIALDEATRRALGDTKCAVFQLYVHDYTGFDSNGRPNGIPNGIPESPGLLVCHTIDGRRFALHFELPQMENKSRKT